MTIKEKVGLNAEILKALKTHTELRNWAIANQMDNRSAFPKFKTALFEIGIDYELLKTGLQKQAAEEIENKITHQVELYTDAKASAGRFGICNKRGEVLWHGRFFDNDNAGEQSRAELSAANKAVWLASKIKEAVKMEAIQLILYVDAEWLTYQSHSGQKGYALTQQARKLNIKLLVKWIPGAENPADKWTTAPGFKKWQDNELGSLVDEKVDASGVQEEE